MSISRFVPNAGWALLFATVALPGCGGDIGTPDASVAEELGVDLGVDLGRDAASDASHDTGMDTGVDGAMDLGNDGAVDAAVDATVDASVDAGGSTHSDSPHFVPSNQPDVTAALMAWLSAARNERVASCECDPAAFELTDAEQCLPTIGGQMGPDAATLMTILTCLRASLTESAILAGINDAISVALTTTACLEAEACSSSCNFRSTTNTDALRAALQSCEP